MAYTPEQNGFAESSGKIICTVARAIRIQSGFREELWPELVRTAVYLLNRTPKIGLDWATPDEICNKKKPDILNLKIAGYRAYVHIPNQIRVASRKLADRAWIGYLIGFDARNIWRIWHPKSKQVVRIRDVVFQEDRLYRDDDQLLESPINIDQFSNTAEQTNEEIIEPRLNRWNLIKEYDSAKQEIKVSREGLEFSEQFQEARSNINRQTCARK